MTLARLKENYRTLLSDDIKARLVIENDEVSSRILREQNLCLLYSVQMCYNVDDLIPVSEELDLPIVVSSLTVDEDCTQRHQFDYHHDWIYASFASWLTF